MPNSSCRLRAPGRPFIAYYPGMTREALAYYGCAELFQVTLFESQKHNLYLLGIYPDVWCVCLFWTENQDVHNELIQHKRLWMRRRGIVKGKLSVNSEEQRLNGSCPLMPEEVSNQGQVDIVWSKWLDKNVEFGACQSSVLINTHLL